MSVGQILSISIPSVISVVGFWISIYTIKKNSQETYKGIVSKLVFEKRLEYFDRLSELLTDLSENVVKNNLFLRLAMSLNIKKNTLKGEDYKVKLEDGDYKVVFNPEKIDKEQVLDSLNKIGEIGNNLDNLITRYYSYIPQEFVSDKDFIHEPLKDYLKFSEMQFFKIFNEKVIEEEEMEELHAYSKKLLLSIYQEQTEVKKEFDKYQI
ncbi:hypothetical protein RZO31_05750 [Lactococcus lactis]|uniref:Uncharacterized protein n=1 Tax=Lactococcus lactis TaxID=1358 RepID=A0AAE4T140_9LACT|nr:hypothetical protein [Lactococcus lactis]MDV2632377.1 hypothetical protein [Lactococcus lactis]